jgi:heme-degrading monooxygenase HmoA
MSQITTLTFFRYTSLKDKLWAFKMMQFAHKPMSKVAGLQFYRLMGSGKGLGFNPFPDWGVYAILQVWENEAAAIAYFKGDLHKRYKQSASEIWTLYMQNIIAKGTWSGSNPFIANATSKNLPLAVITRATIKPKELYHFWKYVPKSQEGLADNPGLIFTKGIGEVPFSQMATFSIWDSEESLKLFAYNQRAHSKAIALTRERNWYSEELFSRFAVIKTTGNWTGLSGLEQLSAE